MPKYLYCATCGVELKQERRAVKGEIYDFIIPHDCDGGHDELSDLPNVMDLINNIKPPQPPKRDEPKDKIQEHKPSLNLKDVRDKDAMVTSIAPQGLLEAMKNQQTTPVNTDDFDLEGDS